jgi:hypothetical protein
MERERVNLFVLQGTTYEGSWDGWYGPSGRTNESSTNFINSVDDVSLIYKNAVNLFLILVLHLFHELPSTGT